MCCCVPERTIDVGAILESHLTPTWAAPQRIVRALAQYRACTLCEHRCGVDRISPHTGPCKAGVIPRVFCHRVEYSEEPTLGASHLFYLSGCDLRCVFCIAELDAFDPSRGQELSSEFFNAAVAQGRSQGARNVQWVGGEPTIHLGAILQVMSRCNDLPPIVWNPHFHGPPQALELPDVAVDTYVPEFKFANDGCANRLAGVKNYLRI